MSMKDYLDKVVFITGASEGIGLALAKEFILAGSKVAIFSRSETKLNQAAHFLTKKTLGSTQKIYAFQVDVTKEKDLRKALTEAIKKLGIPDIFINNVGKASPDYFENISFSQLQETMQINFYSVWNSLAYILPKMKVKGGHVVNVSSMAGYLGIFGYSDYTAAKFAIIGLTEALAAEYQKYKIKFSVLCPPDTNTPGFKEENKRKPLETKVISKSARCLNPEEVAKACLKGIKKGRFIINPGLNAKLIYLIKRFWPGLIRLYLNKRIKKIQRKISKED